jgi:hypothetical protein
MRLARIFLLSALVCGLVPAASPAQTPPERNAAPDPFYLSLLRDGKSEMVRGDAVAARKSFRLACFGFLEQPVLLSEGLVRLGLAEAVLGDREAFVATFSRLGEVEERFAAYAPAALSAEERRSFEEKALEWVAPEALRAVPVFASLLARKSEVDLSKLSPRDRLRELEKRSAAEPSNAQWKILLAQDEAANDRMNKVLTRLEGVPDAAGEGSAGCLRGRALADLKRCAEAVVALGGCESATTDAGLAEAQITCLLKLEQTRAARDFAARVRKPAAEAAAVRKALARIPPAAAAPSSRAPAAEGRSASASPPTPPGSTRTPPQPAPPRKSETEAAEKPAKAPAAGRPGASASAAEPPPGATTAAPPKRNPPPASPSASTLTADEERALATARDMLKSVESRDELGRGLNLARPAADRLPGRADLQLLVAEMAYRAGQWATGADYFRRSSPNGGGPSDPTQRFYYAVCLYEAGDLAGAARVASTGLEKLPRPPFVEAYLQKIRSYRP